VNDNISVGGDTDTEVAIPGALMQLLATFIAELSYEEQLSHETQVLLYRIMPSVCMLAKGDPKILYRRDHPVRQIFDAIVYISKASQEKFRPGDTLYKTVIESIANLKRKNIDGMDCLVRVNADLQHVVKLAKIRAPIAFKRQSNEGATGKITEAKIRAALIISQQSTRFTINETLLQFSLSEWLELLSVTLVKHDHDARIATELERITFLLFYLCTSESAPNVIALRDRLMRQLRLIIKSLGQTCLGHPLDFAPLERKVLYFISPSRNRRHDDAINA
jgi:hypothetical protein